MCVHATLYPLNNSCAEAWGRVASSTSHKFMPRTSVDAQRHLLHADLLHSVQLRYFSLQSVRWARVRASGRSLSLAQVLGGAVGFTTILIPAGHLVATRDRMRSELLLARSSSQQSIIIQILQTDDHQRSQGPASTTSRPPCAHELRELS